MAAKENTTPIESKKALQPSSWDSPVLILSNRLPFTVHRGPRGLERRPSVGGLVSALEPVLRKRGGTWIGWPGIELRPGERIRRGKSPYEVHPIAISDAEVTRFYHGFSNRTLWPLFHSLPSRARFDRRDWETYERVNLRFAEAAVKGAERGEIVWVHDYHLMVAPSKLQERVPAAKIAFFLHIPFPPYDIFRLLPWDREILRGLLACNLVGFHVGGYARNFLDCVEKGLGARVDRESLRVEYGGCTTQVGAFPLGIDFEKYDNLARNAPPSRETGKERIVLGVDRLDYTKGIPERILAFERLLELHPRYRESVVLLQLAVPSRSQVNEYKQLKREIDESVGRVNGRFATATWSPIRYLYRSYSQEQLAGLYRDADVAIVTPIRDGMNLVAKEYVACQVGDPGVLVLSRMAGAAETMFEAVQVNPHNIEGTAEAIHRALTMDEDERRSRMAALRRRERRYDLGNWVRSFLETAAHNPQELTPATDSEISSWLEAFLARYRLALFLDYDGTLTPIVEHPSKAKLSASMRGYLKICLEREDTDVALISGRSIRDLRNIVRDPQLTYAGNHGLEIQGPGLDDFSHPDVEHFRKRVENLASALEEACIDGAWVESKGLTLTYHYRAAKESRHEEMARRARSIILAEGFQARDAHRAVEARPPIGWDKGQAVLKILRTRYGPSWPETVRVIYIGDDQTDEDAFRVLAGLGMNFRVGLDHTLTSASRRLPNVDAVATLLRWLGRRPRKLDRKSEA